MGDIVVVARAHAKAGREEEFLRYFESIMKSTHQEPGCTRYAMHRGLDDSGTFVMVERYRSKADLDQHMASPYIQKLFAEIGEYVDAPPELLFLEPLSDSMGDKGRI